MLTSNVLFNPFGVGKKSVLCGAAKRTHTPALLAAPAQFGQASSSGKPVVLLVLDGWGVRHHRKGNAIKLADPPFYNHLLKTYPWIKVKASGEAVGLPKAQAGNSEVGHLTLGTGRVLYQDLPKINKAIRDRSFFSNAAFLNTINHVKRTGGTLHLMGLVSDGGVHSHINHLLALIDLAKQQGVRNLSVHAFLDGRDTPPQSAAKYLSRVELKLQQAGYPPIATVSGRYYAMDRDKRWDRTEKAFNTLVTAGGHKVAGSLQALNTSYAQGKTDEFVEPVVTNPAYQGMNPGDGMVFFNYRPDRARQLTVALSETGFSEFFRKKVLAYTSFTTMTPYDDAFSLPVAFPKQKAANTLADVVSAHGYKQFHTAETEKYAHVTYFFNGGVEPPKTGEDRKLVASPKVATYDLQPEMSVKQVSDEVVNAIESGQYKLIVANFANPDMVGHTGNQQAAIQAVKSVDTELKRIVSTVLKRDNVMLLTSDHGKVETMVDKQGNPFTAHSTTPVPLVMITGDKALVLDKTVKDAGLSSVAPTILDLLKLPVPAEMTGKSLLKRSQPVPFV